VTCIERVISDITAKLALRDFILEAESYDRPPQQLGLTLHFVFYMYPIDRSQMEDNLPKESDRRSHAAPDSDS
jgi:hypothetical protein